MQPPRDNTRRPLEGFPAPADLPELDDGERTRLLERWRTAAVGQLASGVAHEINNPLFAILGTVEFLLEDAAEGSELHERLLRIQRSGQEIRETVRALVDFAREPAWDRRLLELTGICAEAVQLARRGSLAKGVELVERYPEAPLVVEASANQVKQIVLALVTNAQQAQPAGGEVVVEVAPGDEWALVRVSDRGPGIPDELRPRVFEPFFTTRGAEGASGLGLAVALGLAHLQGGDLAVESAPTGGAAFVLRLPAVA